MMKKLVILMHTCFKIVYAKSTARFKKEDKGR